ncbi:uncharacterized protein TRUGW13939_09530 [Talaromyces rugulosus]|uniref:Uncharacterized protein n=1 Tax=Talaromyces rugulosus TaxID=121627 RepID=A0A7H8R9G4_TALRU|nr:uncharacterized protein TRUGW13939_09530 [Talaromyces rugulosus]QKX62371.1 hypothetical protein TRUGW13939_09530 [Talaromyces rugulosus]
MEGISDDAHSRRQCFSNFHPQAANTSGPFDTWVEGEVDKIHKSIEGSLRDLEMQIKSAVEKLAILSHANYDIAKAFEFLSDDACPGEKVYVSETMGTPIQILLYNRVKHWLWRKAERAKVVSFWVSQKVKLGDICKSRICTLDKLAEAYNAVQHEINMMEKVLGMAITTGPLIKK